MRRLIRPKILFAVAIVAFGSVLAAGTALYFDARADCAAEVRSREGQRTMWLYIVDEFPDARIIDELIFELNRRLPALECRGGDAVPIGE